MKKLTLMMAAAFISVVALTGCTPSTESSDWLKGTIWEADLIGKQVSVGSLDGDRKINGGMIKIQFSSQGYQLNYVFSAELGITSQGEITSRRFPDYNFPELVLPIVVGGDKDDPKIEYCTGIMSNDFNAIHFDTLSTGNVVFKDITFVR